MIRAPLALQDRTALYLQVKASSGGSKQQDGADWNKKQTASEWGEFLHCPGDHLDSISPECSQNLSLTWLNKHAPFCIEQTHWL